MLRRLVPKPVNAILSQPRSDGPAPPLVPQVFQRKTMDLHGLHVAEAVEVLDREMGALAERGLCSVRVLTGTGHHSKGPTNKVNNTRRVSLMREISRKSNAALLGAARGFLSVAGREWLVVFFLIEDKAAPTCRAAKEHRYVVLYGPSWTPAFSSLACCEADLN